MAINKEGTYWTGSSPDDLTEYLDEYSDHTVTKSKVLQCRKCGGNVFSFCYDEDEGAIRVTCTSCNTGWLPLDSEEYWDECDPEKAECSLCGNTTFNLGVGFEMRDTGDVKWVYTADRCMQCEVLASRVDWKISYSPTDELEKNI